jgi:hypothetical protein
MPGCNTRRRCTRHAVPERLDGQRINWRAIEKPRGVGSRAAGQHGIRGRPGVSGRPRIATTEDADPRPTRDSVAWAARALQS